MSNVILRVERIDGMSSAGWERAMSIDCTMTETEMLNALKSFLGNVTDATWYEWLKELAPEYLKDEE